MKKQKFIIEIFPDIVIIRLDTGQTRNLGKNRIDGIPGLHIVN